MSPELKNQEPPRLLAQTSEILVQEDLLRLGGGPEAIARQHEKGRKTARERIAILLDQDAPVLELGLWAGHEMYAEWGGAPAAGVLTVIGSVHGRRVMVVANDATVKAGACFPLTIKKILRAQAIAATNRLPLVYLVDSSGVFLPMQDEVFPDDDDFGRIFRNNAVLSAQGIPQYAAIMGNCVAGGAYLPVLCDTVLMTEGSGLYLAGPSLVKAAIGQNISHDELGGAHVHAAYSGTIDYREPDDDSCLARLRRLVAMLPADPAPRSLPPRSRRRPGPRRIFTVSFARRPRPSTTFAICWPACSTAARLMSFAPSTAGRSSAGSAIWRECRWAWWPASGCGSAPRAARSSSAA